MDTSCGCLGTRRPRTVAPGDRRRSGARREAHDAVLAVRLPSSPKWLRRRKFLDERAPEKRSNEAPELPPLKACMQLSLFERTFLRVDDNLFIAGPDDEHRRGKKSPWVAEVRGFNLHAEVLVHAGDREGLQ